MEDVVAEGAVMCVPIRSAASKPLGEFWNIQVLFFFPYSTTLRQHTTVFSYHECDSHLFFIKLEKWFSRQLPLEWEPRDGNAKVLFYWRVADK